MAEKREVPPEKKAVGITLASVGSVTILKDLHVFEQGSFNLGALVRMDFGGGGTGVTVHDGGVTMRCDPTWSVGPFTKGEPRRLDSDRGSADPAKASPALRAEVGELASLLSTDAPSGTILLIGSGDQTQAVEKNVFLAPSRAAEVKGLLQEQLAGTAHGKILREILVANDALAQPGTGGSGAGQPANLARLLYGADEASARFVQACVLHPRGHSVETWGVAGANSGILQGFVLAATFFAVMAAIAYVLAGRQRNRAASTADVTAPPPSSASADPVPPPPTPPLQTEKRRKAVSRKTPQTR